MLVEALLDFEAIIFWATPSEARIVAAKIGVPPHDFLPIVRFPRFFSLYLNFGFVFKPSTQLINHVWTW